MKNLFKILTIILFSSLSFNTIAQVEYFYGGSICNDEEWQLVFEDEFEGNTLNTDNWYTYQPYDEDDENNDQCPNCRTHFFDDDNEVYLDKNVSVSNGKLHMKVYQEDVLFHGKIFPFSSCQLYSKDTYSNYGRFEIRCKMPNKQNILKAFWVYGWGEEIDIFEAKNAGNIMTTMHHEDYGCSSFTNTLIQPDEYHVYRVDYEKYYIKFYIDDILYQVKPRYPVSTNGLDYACELDPGYYEKQLCYPADYKESPMAVILGPSVDNWITEYYDIPEGENDPILITMWDIDYVRVYEKCGNFPELVVNDGEELTITGDHEYSKIEIYQNGILNIENANINMNTMSGIHVTTNATLNISNSTITSNCDQWEGITGWWQSNINIDNDTYIENAVNGIRLFNGSVATLTNSTIRHCTNGFLLESIDKNCNIENVDFEENETGIQAENSKGVNISYSKFSDNKHGITSFDSYLNITEGNLFIDNVDYHISIDGTYPLSSGSIIGVKDATLNRFINSTINGGILCRGNTHPAAVDIIGNLFENSGIAGSIDIVGSNDILIANNDFQNCDQVVSFFSSGDDYNKVKCNNYLNNEYFENIFCGDNQKTTFLGNQSSGQSWYNYVLADNAKVAPYIGTYDNPAENCFSNNNYTTDIETYQNDNVPFTYFFHDDGSSDNCEEPKNPGNYNPQRTPIPGHNCEGHYGPFNKIDPNGDGYDGIDTVIIACCLPDILDSVDYWIDVVIEKGGDNPKTTEDEGSDNSSPELWESEEILDQWINFGIYAALETENFGFAEQLLSPLVTMRWQKRLYGIKIRQKKYIEAKEVLENLPQNTQEQIYFKTVQDINLKRFEGIESGEWTIDDIDITTLKNIAQSDYPAKGYANSLYTRLTGELLPINLPNIPEKLEGREAFNGKGKDKLSDQTIYPNPATDELFINMENETKSMIVEIYNTDGKKIFDRKVASSFTKVDVSKLQSGIYFVKILKDDGTKVNKKVFIE